MADRQERKCSIEDCNRQRIPILFDASVIIDAIRDRSSRAHELILRVSPPLRRCASVTRYEVVFAPPPKYAGPWECPQCGSMARPVRPQPRGATGRRSREDDSRYLRDHFNPIEFHETVGSRFDQLLRDNAHLIRGQVGLGDLLLWCWAGKRRVGRGEMAVAAKDGDFKRLPVLLVEEFLRL